MGRWSLAWIIVGAGIACGALVLAPAIADDKDAKTQESGASKDREAGDDKPEARIDKGIENFDNRASQELEQARKDIDRLQKELNDLFTLQFSLAIPMAELQADLRAQAAENADNRPDKDKDKDKDKDSSAATRERERQRNRELSRELRQVQENLRNVVQQKRAETEQFVAQLRDLRAQYRQMAAERERVQQAANDSKD